MKKFWIVLFLWFCGTLFGNCAEQNLTILNYKMDIKVGENAVYDISENIDAYFFNSMHGLFRSIPVRGNIYRNGEKVSKYRAQISDVSVNNRYSVEHSGGFDTQNYVLKIGDPNRYVDGSQNYKINYKYKALEMSGKRDEVYYNLVGSEWEIPIENFSFTLTMPKEFDHSQVYFYDKNGDSKNVQYRISGNTIRGRYNEELQPGEYFTIHILLPKGYFERNVIDYILPYLKYIPFLFPVCMLIFIYNLWYKYGKDEKTYEVVEFEPPENLNPVEIAYIYKQSISRSDVATLLIHLANKGYLKIEEVPPKGFLSETSYKFVKIKDFDEEAVGDGDIEMKFFNKIFSGRKSTSQETLENSTELYTVANSIIKKVEKSFSMALFEKESLKWQKTVYVYMILTWIAMAVYISFMSILPIIIHLIIFPIIGYTFLSSGIQKKDVPTVVFGTLWSIITVTVLGVFIMTADYSLLLPMVLTIACIIGMDVLRFYMTRWTSEGNRIYGRVLGFKKFLEKVEVDKLQRFVDKDPKYFYKIIPYAYVFGLETKWFSKFAKLTCPPPDFYQGNNFTIHSFSSFNSIMSSVSRSCTPPSSSGGGHGGFGSGGGCGGGGCGGGGGGGW